MSGPYTSYIVDLLHRIDSKYDSLVDQMRRVEKELKTVQEVIKSREDERISYQKWVFDMLVTGNSSDNNGDGLEEPKSEFGMKKNNTVSLDEGQNIEEKAQNMNMDYSLNDALGKEQVTPVKNSWIGQMSPVLKSGTTVVEPHIESFVVAETSKSYPLLGKDVYIKKTLVDKATCSNVEKATFGISTNCLSDIDKDDICCKTTLSGTCLASESIKFGGGRDLRISTRSLDLGKKESYTVGPYTVNIARIVPRDIAIVEYIFGENMDETEYIVETEYNYLKREMIYSLLPGKFLFDEVINVMAELLSVFEIANSAVRRNWFITTRLSATKIDLRLPEGRCKKYCNNYYMGDLVDCKNIFIPIHECFHWLLFVFRVDEGKVEIWDSLLSDGQSRGRHLVESVMTKLDLFLSTQIRSCKPVGWSFKKFKVVTCESAAQQCNGFDCGIFVVSFMEQRDFNRLPFFSDDERVRLLLKIVKSNCNKFKNKVIEASMKYYRDSEHHVKLARSRKHGNISMS